MLQLLAQSEQPRRVVDLGAGTGLSTRPWSDRAREVIGVEANDAMLQGARAATTATNVRYLGVFAAATGLEDGSADLVTCSQAFHWMDPRPTLAEAARLLRAGGVFAAYDYDVPPLVHPEVDAAFAALFHARRAARTRLGLEPGAATWPKEGHLERIHSSGHFRVARELVCHCRGDTSAARLIGLAESIGGPRALFGGDAPEVDARFEGLCDTAAHVLGEREWPIFFCYRIRVGVK
jgi:ubiquinone/menaquinone biosynthesis C-methylase UbiE